MTALVDSAWETIEEAKLKLWTWCLFAVALSAIALFSYSPPPAHALDYDCADFANQAEAEEYLLPGDPHRLDADDDGRACEDLPCPCDYTPNYEDPPPPPPSPRLDKSDARHAAQEVAQRFARRTPRVSSAAVGICNRFGDLRVDCAAVARGQTATTWTTCHLRIPVHLVDGLPKARLASVRCTTRATNRVP